MTANGLSLRPVRHPFVLVIVGLCGIAVVAGFGFTVTHWVQWTTWETGALSAIADSRVPAGIVLAAYGLKTAIGHHDEHLHGVQAFALFGGTAIYLLGLVGFRYRHIHTVNRQRLGLAIVLLILVPVATELPALAAVAIVDLPFWAMIAYEHRGYGDRRDQLRHEAAVGGITGG